MYNGLLHLHNILRWLILIFLIIAIARHLSGMNGRKPYTNGDRRVDLLLMIFTHIQFLIGLYQWIAGPLGIKNILNIGMGEVMKNAAFRFWAIEHFVGMLVAVVLITIGRGAGKKNISDRKKHSTAFWLFLVALLIILATIPWPFREGIGRPLLPGM